MTYRLLATEVTIINPALEVLEIITVGENSHKVYIKVGLGSPNNQAVFFEIMLYGFEFTNPTNQDALDWANEKIKEYEI